MDQDSARFTQVPATPRPRAQPAGRHRDRLVEDHLSYVRAIAAKVKEQLPREIEFDDLVAYGTQGLIEAAERYDPKYGAAFTTFSYYRIRGAIYDGLRGMGWLKRSEYARTRCEERAAQYLGNLAERDLSEEGTDTGSKKVEDNVRQLAKALHGVATIFVTSLELVGDNALRDRSPQAEERLEHAESVRAVRAAFEQLPQKERTLLDLYYFKDQTLEEAGAALGLSKSWASRLHARAVELLGDALAKNSGIVVPHIKTRARR